MTTNPNIATHQHAALKNAATRLAEEFSPTFNVETIERFLHTSFDQVAESATIETFLPLLAERFARQQLQALARNEGHVKDGKPVVLFLCVHNAGRSQMALGFFAQYASDNAIAWSGGSAPGGAVGEVAIAAMAEKGIDIAGEFPKPWTDEVVRAADVVITMGCGDACPIFPGTRYEEWVLEDPAGQDLEAVRPIRDDIEQRVPTLLEEIGVPHPEIPSRRGVVEGARESPRDGRAVDGELDVHVISTGALGSGRWGLVAAVGGGGCRR